MQGEAGARSGAAGGGLDVFGLMARFAPLIFLLVLMAAFAILSPRFLTPLNLFNVMRQVSIYGLLAVGMTFVILTRGIDLSVGSLVALAGLMAAIVAKGGLGSRFAVGAETRPRPKAMAGSWRSWRRLPWAPLPAGCRDSRSPG